MDLLNILLWNIGKRDLSSTISFYAYKYKIDILILVEDQIPHAQLLNTLNAGISKYNWCSTNSRGISFYSTFNNTGFSAVHTDSAFVSMIQFSLVRKSLLISGVHFPSMRTVRTEAGRASIARAIRADIERAESLTKLNNTILAGDFNMNPFETAMVEADAFNSVMSMTIAGRVYRKVAGLRMNRSLDYPYFYNPMWSFMGDLSKYSPGTYYHHDDNVENHYKWNMLDQVLIRPSLIPNFVPESLRILDTNESGALLINENKGKAHKSQLCDHLPVTFSLDLTK